MILPRIFPGMCSLTRGIALVVATLTLVACAEVDDTTGSRLTLPPPGSEPRKPVDMGDVAIVGQEVAHAIMDLPVVANATTPPMVQFTGVTSIINGPVDTEPYTTLLRDRILLLKREKLRFVERTLPPLIVTPKKGKKHPLPTATPEISSEPDYQILAELRGKIDAKFYRIEVQFVDAHTRDVLFDGLYRINKEMPEGDAGTSEPAGETAPPPGPDPNIQPAEMGTPPPQ